MTQELIQYIYETPIDKTEFKSTDQKGDRALILLAKYGYDKQAMLEAKFGDKVNFGNIRPKKAIEICNQINNYSFICGQAELNEQIGNIRLKYDSKTNTNFNSIELYESARLIQEYLQPNDRVIIFEIGSCEGFFISLLMANVNEQ